MHLNWDTYVCQLVFRNWVSMKVLNVFEQNNYLLIVQLPCIRNCKLSYNLGIGTWSHNMRNKGFIWSGQNIANRDFYIFAEKGLKRIAMYEYMYVAEIIGIVEEYKIRAKKPVFFLFSITNYCWFMFESLESWLMDYCFYINVCIAHLLEQ